MNDAPRSVRRALPGCLALALACVAAGGPGSLLADGPRLSTRAATLLSVPATTAGEPGALVQIPITVTPGDGILGVDLTLTYSTAVLEAQSVTVSGIAAAAGFDLVANLNASGVVQISTYATGDALVGSGEIARIQFRVRGSVGETSPLTFTTASINEGAITPSFHNGVFKTVATTTILSLPIDAQGGSGSIVSVPIGAAPADGILGIDLVVNYDPAVLSAQSVTVSGIAAARGFAAAANLTRPGVIIVSSYATSNPLVGSGEILRIDFLVLGVPGSASGLTFASASINEGAIPAAFSQGFFLTNCAGAANGLPCDDGNPATCADVCGAGVCGGTPVPEPAEVNDTVRLTQSGAAATITWSDAPGPFNAYRGVIPPGGPFTYNQACLDPGVPMAGPPFVDTQVPPTGTVFFYLVTRVDRCRESIPGTDSSGAPVPNPQACPIAGP